MTGTVDSGESEWNIIIKSTLVLLRFHGTLCLRIAID